MTDPVADFLTRVRNAIRADHDDVDIPASGLKKDLARILKEQGYVEDFSVEPARVGNVIRVRLKYDDDRTSAISGIERASRPGKRYYVNRTQIPRILGGMGTAIVSTSTGVMTGHDAKQKGVGGEVVAFVW